MNEYEYITGFAEEQETQLLLSPALPLLCPALQFPRLLYLILEHQYL